MDQINNKYNEASNFSGWLLKESSGFIKKYQKRFFSILNGRFLVYCENEGNEVKGKIDLIDAKVIGNLDNVKNFIVIFGDREFKLKAENESQKLNWVKVLNCIHEQLNLKKSFFPIHSNKEVSNEIQSKEQMKPIFSNKDKHKLCNLEPEVLNV